MLNNKTNRSINNHFYYADVFYINYTEPKYKNNFDPAQPNEVLEESVNSTINIIGLFAALLVSVVIIVGLAFVIRKIRKRQVSENQDEDTTASEGKQVPEVIETIYKPEIYNQDEATQTFTITFTEIPKKNEGIKRWIPRYLRPKPKKVDIEKLKRELGQIYVY